MKYLIIDIGNTNIVFAVCNESKILTNNIKKRNYHYLD